MKIYSIAVNIHDHNTYDGIFHNQIERHNRVKHNLNPSNSHDEDPSRQFFCEHFLSNYLDKEELFAFSHCAPNGMLFVIAPRGPLERREPETCILGGNKGKQTKNKKAKAKVMKTTIKI